MRMQSVVAATALCLTIIPLAAADSVRIPDQLNDLVSSCSPISAAVIVETHRFGGSSTEIAAFQEWFDGGEYVKPSITTMDWRALPMPDGTEAAPGSVIGKDFTGCFHVTIPALFD